MAYLSLLLVLWQFLSTGAQEVRLTVQSPSAHSNGVAQILSPGQSNYVHFLQSSSNLEEWREIATLHEGPFSFTDWQSSTNPFQFYRTSSRPLRADDDGKNQVVFPEDPFRSEFSSSPNGSRWIKFALLLSDPGRIWFQDSAKYPFHYDWVIKRLPGFAGMSRPQFDAVSLRTNGQQVVLGAVLYSPPTGAGALRPEYGIQFVGLDPYPASQVVQWFRRVEAAVYNQAGATSFYMPAYEQRGVARDQRAVFENQGIRVSDLNRWLSGDICYSDGWALGRLVFIPADQIAAAYADGRLKPSDVLLTDGIPAEIPYVAGIITLTPATPNSHVAILARSYRIPFLFAADPLEQDRLRALSQASREVLFSARDRFFYCESKTAAVDASLDPALRAGILALKAPGTIKLTPKARLGAISTNLDLVMPQDIRFIGGKAANFGVLRRSIPSNAPPAMALSFDLWDEFLDQVLPDSSKILRQEIRDRTAGLSYPPDINAARAALAGIRDLIRGAARFSEAQQQSILQALLNFGFDPSRKIRFRSSTNVEDSEQFTGAGLYDSYSGCLSDDLDGDSTGPSACDPSESGERGVFRAIQRVYAAFYNDNAWLERLRFGLDEEAVGMAVLVHHSYPDEIEMANGVATLEYNRSDFGTNFTVHLVTQLGAVSVANPEGGAIPEEAQASWYGFSVFLDKLAQSNLVPLGGTVMTWEKDYRDLVDLLAKASHGYAALFPQASRFVLDFEYKKVQPGKLEVKQIREIPQLLPGERITPFLLNERITYCPLQGEQGDIMALHRLKSRLTLSTRNLRLHATNLAESLYREAVAEFVVGTNLVTLTNGMAGWPEAHYALSDQEAQDSWTIGTGEDRRRFTLQTSLIREVDSTENPLLTPGDLFRTLQVQYGRPMPSFGFDGPGTTTNDTVRLTPCLAVTSQSILQNRKMAYPSGLQIDTSFYWPEPPQGPTAGYTAPLVDWVETRITGLTTQPLVLRGFFSQTYHPFHHNFSEEFLFEPALEPGLPAEQLEELRSKDIQMIVANWGDFQSGYWVLGLDGKLRQVDTGGTKP